MGLSRCSLAAQQELGGNLQVEVCRIRNLIDSPWSGAGSLLTFCDSDPEPDPDWLSLIWIRIFIALLDLDPFLTLLDLDPDPYWLSLIRIRHFLGSPWSGSGTLLTLLDPDPDFYRLFLIWIQLQLQLKLTKIYIFSHFLLFTVLIANFFSKMCFCLCFRI